MKGVVFTVVQGLKERCGGMIRTIYVLAKHHDAFDAQVNEALEEGYEIETIELITDGKFMDSNMLYALLIKKDGVE